jgi:signal recognition particle subunit SRP54
MFDRLTDSFNGLFRKFSGNATITEKNIADAMTEVRTSLLEADVSLDVVNAFTQSVMQDAIGKDVTKSLKPGQEMIGIVYDRLVSLLGDAPNVPADATPQEAAELMLKDGPGVLQISPGPTIVMMCGLQGSGKTTTCGKLAAWLKKRNRSVMLVAADLQRPAAVEQLQTVAAQVAAHGSGPQVVCYAEPEKSAEYGKAVGVAVGVCQRALAEARKLNIDTVILDTAGRLHVNDELMGELDQVNRNLRPHQIFLVVDAMTGQDAVRSAKAFHTRLTVDGLIMTKFDSDTRGGAALSVKSVTGAPIRFIGVGEKLDALEEFHAARIAGRILGMGDVLSLVQKAKEEVSEEDARKLEEKIAKGQMGLDDFLSQLKSIRRMGPLKQLMGLLPGVGSAMKDLPIDDKQLDRIEGIVHSMTPRERRDVNLLSNSRRARIAKGSGQKVEAVGGLVNQFKTVSTLMKSFGGMTPADRANMVKTMQSGGMGGMAGLPGLPGFGAAKGSSFTPSIKSKFKKRK